MKQVETRNRLQAKGVAFVTKVLRESAVFISGPELESTCDIVRTVLGVLGERMLGGGDKAAAGYLVLAGDADKVKVAVDMAYPRSHPAAPEILSVVNKCDCP